jgi:phosphoribosylformylglycinamidine synthase subunit PurS
MNKYIAEIDVMPLKALLDPQGKAVTSGLKNLGLKEIDNVRIGKHITLEIEARDKDEAHGKVRTACEKLLANPIMESFEFHIKESSAS